MEADARLPWARFQVRENARRPFWRYLALVLYAAANVLLLLALRPAPNADWATTWWLLPAWIADGELYAHTWRYSPLALPIMELIIRAGPIALIGLQVGAILLLARLGRIVLLRNRPIGVRLDGYRRRQHVHIRGRRRRLRPERLALRSTRLPSPHRPDARPVQIPMALWLLWTRPDTRWPFALLALVTLAVAAGTGLLGPWLGALMGATSEIAAAYSIGPGAVFGNAWLLIGVPLATILAFRGWPATAGLALSPYLLPQYLALGLTEAASWLSRMPETRTRPRTDEEDRRCGGVRNRGSHPGSIARSCRHCIGSPLALSAVRLSAVRLLPRASILPAYAWLGARQSARSRGRAGGPFVPPRIGFAPITPFAASPVRLVSRAPP